MLYSQIWDILFQAQYGGYNPQPSYGYPRTESGNSILAPPRHGYYDGYAPVPVHRNPYEDQAHAYYGGYDQSPYGYGYAPAFRYPYANHPDYVLYQYPRIQYQQGGCDCSYNWRFFGGGCYISNAADQNFACQCSYVGFWTCSGSQVRCNSNNAICANPDLSHLACLEGQGDCGGYFWEER